MSTNTNSINYDTVPSGFCYVTSNEAMNRDHANDPAWTPLSRALNVDHIAGDLEWGLTPLGWRYLGHDTKHAGNNDYWHPPGDPRIRAKLQIPRDRLHGQVTVTLLVYVDNNYSLLATAGRSHSLEANVWQATVTTRQELNNALLELHKIAGHPDTLSAYVALKGFKATPQPV
jgi:hypothetical protein